MEPLTLTTFQHCFTETARRADDAVPSPELLRHMTPAGTLTGEDALEVYRRGHIVRLTEALGDLYEAVWWACGDDEFFRLAKTFILTHPSTTYNLSSYGETFASFLEEARPFPDLPFLPDLARFEWLFNTIFHRRQHQAASAEQIRAAAQHDDVTLHFGESVRIFSAPYAVYAIWKQRGGDHGTLEPADWSRPQCVLLYKQDQQIFVKALSETDAALLSHLMQGASLRAALDRAADTAPDLTDAHVSALFQLLVRTEVICDITACDPPAATNPSDCIE